MSHGAYYFTAYHEGKQRWMPLGRDIGQALRKYYEMTGYAVPVGRTVNDLVERFRREELPKLRASSQRNYLGWIPAIEKTWGKMILKDVRQPDVAVFLDNYPQKVTANRVATLFCTMMKRAKRWGWIDVNYLEGLEKNREEPRKRLILPEEWAALLRVAYDHYGLLLRLAKFTALRRSDICALTWANIRGDRLMVTTEKTQAPISIKIAGDLAEVLAELRRGITPFPTRPLFTVAGGRPLQTKMLGYHFDAIRKSAGLRGINFHDIRRTRITELTERYGLAFAQKLATHTDPRTTQRYNVPEAVLIEWPEDEIRGDFANKRQGG